MPQIPVSPRHTDLWNDLQRLKRKLDLQWPEFLRHLLSERHRAVAELSEQNAQLREDNMELARKLAEANSELPSITPEVYRFVRRMANVWPAWHGQSDAYVDREVREHLHITFDQQQQLAGEAPE